MNDLARILFFLILFIPEIIDAQVPAPVRTWIFFKSKDISNPNSINPAEIGISDRALRRRAKTLPPDKLIDELDVPVSTSAIEQVESTGARIRTISRWFNAVSVTATEEQLQTLKNLPVVSNSEPVVNYKRKGRSPSSENHMPFLQKESGNTSLGYGNSGPQLANIKVIDLHNLAVNGTGVLIGMMDDGFNGYRTHEALKNIHVVADSDFIHNIKDVNRQPWENSTQGNHGAGTFSALGGLDNSRMVGAAYGASFILAKTEMDSSGNNFDFNSEEDTYVAALEWMERLGADITSSSLGYKEFWGSPTYVTSDMDGRTTKVARVAVIAARKGVPVVTAMGNEGGLSSGLHINSTLISPADADSILAIGATTYNGILANFSSCGPSADGRIKPDVVAQGVSVYWADGTSGYVYVQGTSCSTPLAAGAAALILSAHPELTNMQIRQALFNTAGHINDGTIQTSVYPNNYYGNGFINALDAALSCGPVFSNSLKIVVRDSIYRISVWSRQASSSNMNAVRLYFKRGSEGVYQEVGMNYTGGYEYTAELSLSSLDSTSVGFVSAYDRNSTRYLSPHDTSHSLYSLAVTPDDLLNYFPKQEVPTEYVLNQNFPNPFNGTTTIMYQVPYLEEIELDIFNLIGQHVKSVFRGMVFAQGVNKWDGTDDNGKQVASGIYFLRLKGPNILLSRKMLYLK